MKTAWLQEFGRCEGLERISTKEMSPEERRSHMRALSLADSAYAHASAVVGSEVARKIEEGR